MSPHVAKIFMKGSTKPPIPSVPGRPTRRWNNKSKGDDARTVVNRLSAKFDVLVKGFSVIGTLPWDEKKRPRFLYHHSLVCEPDPVFVSFCFPKEEDVKAETRCVSKLALLKEFISDEHLTSAEFVPLYFPQDDGLRFAFCMRIAVNELSCPAFCHDLSLPQILEKIDRGNGQVSLTTTTIVLVMRCKVPYLDGVSELMKWMIKSELVSKMMVCDQIDDYIHSSVVPQGEGFWPNQHRDTMKSIVSRLLQSVTPDPGQEFELDFQPFPLFRWARPSVQEHPYISLGRQLMHKLITFMDCGFFIRVFTEVMLEKTVVIYSKNMQWETETVLCLQVLLRPFVWILASISCLPQSLSDMVYSPNPVLIGTTFLLENVDDDCIVYADLDTNTIVPKARSDIEVSKSFIDDVKANWTPEKADNLYESIKTYMEHVAHILDRSIVTDFSDKNDVSSRFLENIFLGHFPNNEQQFFKAFCSTQLFRFTLEQKCRIQSDAHQSDML